MKRTFGFSSGTAFGALLLGFFVTSGFIFLHKLAKLDEVKNTERMITIHLPFIYSFNSPGTLYEAGSAYESSSPYWYLNSGGKLILTGSLGETVQGDLPASDIWAKRYADSNPIDTDNGLHPQNLFRLVTRASVDNVSVEARFFIAKNEHSASPNRNASNGLLLMSRYAPDGQTLYYAGIRVDGTAVIKKKYKGTYYTMAQKQIFPGTYDPDANSNLLPHAEWITLKSDTKTNTDGTVAITLWMKRANDTAWTKLLTATDTGKNYGSTPPIHGPAPVGIRTDFMDVEFENFRVDSLN